MSAALKTQAAALKEWMSNAALPFWAKHGIDKNGGFYEDLHLDRRPNKSAVRRVRVQSRQIFVYAQATRLGWYDGTPVADKTYAFLEKYGYQRDGKHHTAGGYAHRIGPDYAIIDGSRDFYDHAFHLLGAATLSALPNAKYVKAASSRADEILGFIDFKLESETSGWLEGIPASTPRRQNPHMHYLEASMALYDVTRNPKHLMPARIVYGMFTRHFFDAENAVVSEFFENDWTLANGALGQTAEPGHATEWVWLLSQFEKRTGIDTRPFADALYERAFIGNPVFLNDEEDKQGRPRRSTKRLWVQTEVIRAHLAQMERGNKTAESAAVRAIEAFREHYLNDDGTWMDQLDAQGMPCAKTIPVSTFYHILGMVSEADRLTK